MWHEELKSKYSKETFALFLKFIAGKSYEFIMNNATGFQDFYYFTMDVMKFERDNGLDNSQRTFPQIEM